MASTEVAYSLWIDTTLTEIPQLSKHKQFSVGAPENGAFLLKARHVFTAILISFTTQSETGLQTVLILWRKPAMANVEVYLSLLVIKVKLEKGCFIQRGALCSCQA